ncbi:alpha/beta hydrolase [Engelhardtia mirabilis]|uniref:Alpha/beta hydrolase family protein n=1 Tax=Engelhardtia mirabilis TaxID=2528011 RepID=A0A518BHK2_9BACT|nr:Alpha/beta hydrolase family protein [Planctomycetes bacterium Pla133]QDV00788.1 Alpha/beta hydrolase family protein [Planctomycetes bacterium Pla86]
MALTSLITLVAAAALAATTQEPAPPAAAPSAVSAPATVYRTVTFQSGDGLEITADLYVGEVSSPQERSQRPFIVLFHQAGWSRGEYREIAPQLVLLGFDCLAVDQRSGGAVNDVVNATNARAVAAELPTRFTDAEQDMVAALAAVRRHLANGRTLVAWGSSYSSALVLRLAADHPELVDAWVAFAPGDYFEREGKPKDWIASAALRVTQPGFLTSARRERGNWEEIWDNLPSTPNEGRWYFLPETEGNHGSRALWARFEDSGAYWAALEPFLDHVYTLERPAPLVREQVEDDPFAASTQAPDQG